MTDLVNGLNPQQKEAVLHEGSPLLILAGAGSGKTKVLTTRITHFVKNRDILPHRILAVTFTNKAAKEMRERIQKIVGAKVDFPFLGTFHSISVRILKVDGIHVGLEPTFTIYDSSDQKDLVKEAMKTLNIDAKSLNPSAVHSAISSAKNDMVTPKMYAGMVGDLFTEQVSKIYPLYQTLLAERNAVDFDDLIMKTINLMQDNEEIRERYIDRFDQILVDEYQDTNKAQYSLIRMLAMKKQNITVVGDEDQSIYGWRGADIQNILSFEKDFKNPKIIKLEQNYRSTQIILDAAYSVINKNTERREKKLWSDVKKGPLVQVYEAQNEIEEAMFITKTIAKMKTDDLKEIAVLYRANAQSRAIEEQFLKAKIPYRLVGGQRFYDRKEIKDVLGYMRVFYNPSDVLSLQRVVNTPPRGIGPKTITEMINLSKDLSVPIVDLITNVALIDDFKDDIKEYRKSLGERDKNKQDPNSLFAEEKKKHVEDPFIEALLNFSDMLGDAKLQTSRPVINFGKRINEIRDYMVNLNVSEFIKTIIENMDYLTYINDNTKEGESRLENIKEFLSVASKYDSMTIEAGLAQFLEDVSLIEEAQERDEKNENKQVVNLMTIHAAKGLEFGTVFVAGMEEGIFPHSRSLADMKEMEEERRLMYVAVTRAKKNLYLLYAITRTYFGNTQSNVVSRFIADIPEDLMEFHSVTELYDSENYDLRKNYKDEFDVGEATDIEYMDLGDRVLHPQFGEGRIVDIDNDMVTIDFLEKGPTKIMAQFAKLRKL